MQKANCVSFFYVIGQVAAVNRGITMRSQNIGDNQSLRIFNPTFGWKKTNMI